MQCFGPVMVKIRESDLDRYVEANIKRQLAQWIADAKKHYQDEHVTADDLLKFVTKHK